MWCVLRFQQIFQDAKDVLFCRASAKAEAQWKDISQCNLSICVKFLVASLLMVMTPKRGHGLHQLHNLRLWSCIFLHLRAKRSYRDLSSALKRKFYICTLYIIASATCSILRSGCRHVFCIHPCVLTSGEAHHFTTKKQRNISLEKLTAIHPIPKGRPAATQLNLWDF